MEKIREKRNMAVPVCVVLICMYVLTFALLALAAFALYKGMLAENAVGILIQVIYVISGFFGGFLCGKIAGSKKYLWGLLVGVLYFGVLLLAGYLMNHGFADDHIQIVTRMLLCVLSAVAGGMVS